MPIGTQNKNKAADPAHSWSAAVNECGLFYGRETAIVLVAKDETCQTCGNQYRKVLKRRVWVKKIAEKGKRKRWVVAEDLPLDCDADAALAKYGHPYEFITGCGTQDENEVPDVKVY